MTAAREFQILRRLLFDHLGANTYADVNMTALNKATARVTPQGWTAADIASQIIGDYGNGNPAALIVARANKLDGPPPRETTPTPPPAQTVLRDTLNQHPATNPHRWITAIRERNTP